MTAPVPNQPVADDELAVRLANALGARVAASTVASILGAGVDIAEAAVKMLLELDGIRGLLQVGEAAPLSAGPVRAQHRQNLLRRGAYLVNAARRLTTAVVAPSPVPRGQRIEQALQQEGVYLRQHLDAVNRRNSAARQVAALANQHGPLLGWYAKNDERTSAECRAAHGHNFTAAQIPLIGYPGSVHPHCRCRPGPPHRSGLLLGGQSEPRQPAPSLVAALSGRAKALEAIELSRSYVGRHRRPDQAVELVSSRVYPSLERRPGKQNWVDKAGGLPDYIERIAKHLHYEKGMTISRAIATAVNTVKKWATGAGNVSAATQAKAAKAVAQWEAKKARSRG